MWGNNSRNRQEEERNRGNSWYAAAAVGALGAAVGGLYLWLSRSSEPSRAEAQSRHDSQQESNLSTLLSRVNIRESRVTPQSRGVDEELIPQNPYINNLDSLLHDIYIRYIALKKQDFKHHYKVFDTIFLKIHRTMQRVDPYYRQYSSTVQVAGSHYDRLRVKKPDEFDIDIFIGLPLNLKPERCDPSKSDIILESLSAGYVRLKMGTQFQKLPYRDGWDINKTLYSWKDDDYYLLRSKFSDWFKSLVYRALNEFDEYGNYKMCYVENNPYVIRTSESGPAVTLKIKCLTTNFKMDVDLVPVLKFPEERWPSWDGYRAVPSAYRHEKFMVVPKPIKGELGPNSSSRSWRMSLIYQEKNMLHDTYNLRQTIRFLKTLRDTLGMSYLASYYIKTLFYWEVYERGDPQFWRQAPSKLFIIMVKRLHAALSRKRIPYFWNEEYNLIEGAASNVVAGDVAKLVKLQRILENPLEYKKVTEYLLTPSEQAEYSVFL